MLSDRPGAAPAPDIVVGHGQDCCLFTVDNAPGGRVAVAMTPDAMEALGLRMVQQAAYARAAATGAGTTPPAAALAPDLLTDAEHQAIETAGQLWTQLAGIIGRGPTRAADSAELVALVHGIQRAVMKQAAARAYPDRYRLLGETIPAAEGSPR